MWLLVERKEWWWYEIWSSQREGGEYFWLETHSSLYVSCDISQMRGESIVYFVCGMDDVLETKRNKKKNTWISKRDNKRKDYHIHKAFLEEFSFFWTIFIFHSFLSIHEYEQDSFYPSVFRLCLSLVFCGKEKNGSCISLRFFISMTLRQSSKPIFQYNSPIIVYACFMLLNLIICDF